MNKRNRNVIPFPAPRRASKPPVPPKRRAKKTAQTPAPEWVFSFVADGVPAVGTIRVSRSSYREALGCAYLIAERFTEKALAALKNGGAF